ncbi:UDP-N-acetylmuramate dehydrogenase [Galbibacter mesophilus]|uniref:UDP-N-acetylmuramate dehydrogenase n=1 Tax=Galbibacter mesophilus TaxID=379069 RepID=UPI00191E2D29|nr:UDP-N-acetylmuramate dehydrogenase [Galbibacter mesophilus]MCM5664377.1 UDP-N-acetylmuramate dehydrogenase [Galbibacter mesophilus]
MDKKPSIQQNVSLKPYNTFGIDVKAANFVSVVSVEELKNVLQLKKFPHKFILGGGSNMLLTKNVDGLVIHLNLTKKEIIEETNDHVLVKAQAGENWHEFVLWSLEQGFGGLENLSLIPGNVGTAPIQNIGAYGVELKDVFYSCEAIDIQTLETATFTKEDCKFGYRDSYFKRNKGQYIITSVTFKLSKAPHTLNISYGAIEAELSKKEIENPGIKDVSNAVIAIRQSKLPDPKVLGNSGSFFKNPVIGVQEFEKLQEKHPTIPHYIVSNEEVKVPAGWLIEQCGFKGKRFGDAGVHKNQALVLVNYGNATGEEIWDLALRIQQKVKETFQIEIEPEVNVY